MHAQYYKENFIAQKNDSKWANETKQSYFNVSTTGFTSFLKQAVVEQITF